MDYNQALDLLFNALPVFQFNGAVAYKPGIERIVALDERLAHPHRKYKTIHIAGTNGKGSSSHTLASILAEAGLRVGLYTSPHLKDFRERIRVCGEMISEAEVVDFVERNIDFATTIGASFFELTAAMAFEHFERNEVDVAIVEVGLGGRLDATNVISPCLSIITNIGLDHTQFLGSTLLEIAAEKAGIIKFRTPVIIGQGGDEIDDVFEERAAAVEAPIVYAEDVFELVEQVELEEGQSLVLERVARCEGSRKYCLELDLMGRYQAFNIKTVIAAVEALVSYCGFDISREAIEEGAANVVKNTGLLGRWQVLSRAPLTVCDTGHNAHGIAEVVAQIARQSYKKLYVVIGMVSDKNIDSVLALLPREAYYIFTQADIARAMDAHDLMSLASGFGLEGEVVKSVEQAYALARVLADKEDMIYIGGSNFVVAEVL